jgi:sorbitol/mannitol transport system substrate-binding protein
MRKTLFLTLSILVIMSMVLTACAPVAPAATGPAAQAPAPASGVTELTIITVNNPDMKTMQALSPEFEKAYPNIKLNWVVLPENELRARVTTDVATGSGSFDVVTVGTYEVPIWAENGWLVSVDELMTQNPDSVQPEYDKDDLLASIRSALSYEDQLYAVPFYGESSMTFYNKKLFADAGLTMPEQPTWEQIREFACQLHKPDEGQYGIVLRGLPGWGEIFAPLTTVVNTFGGRWFDENWQPQLTTQEWNDAVNFYVKLIQECGEPGATGVGFTEALTLIAQGKAAMWVDATVAAGFLKDPNQSTIVDDVGFAMAPQGPATDAAGYHWLWAWSLAIPNTSAHQAEALQFVTWATSKDYVKLVGETNGWATVPPGTRASTYAMPEYLEAAGDFAPLTLKSIETADPQNCCALPVPYVGVQFVGIPEFQGLGTDVSQYIADALAGKSTVEEALAKGQAKAEQVMKDAGYIK